MAPHSAPRAVGMLDAARRRHPVLAWTFTVQASAGPHWRRLSARLLLLLFGCQVVCGLQQVNISVMK